MSKFSGFVRDLSLATKDNTPPEIRSLITRYKQFAKDVDLGPTTTKSQLSEPTQKVQNNQKVKEDSPKNLIIFIRDQVKPTDLWFPRGWDTKNMPTQRWLKDNGLSFSNSFTNTSMCSVSRSTFFTSKYPAQHQADLILSDISNPVLDSQVQLNPDLPNLGNILTQGSVGYDVSFFGKFHLSKTITLRNGETLYQNPKDYGFEGWQGPDAGQDMDANHAGLGPKDNDQRFIDEAKTWLKDRLDSGNEDPFVMVVSLVNPHDVLAYPQQMQEFEFYSDKWLEGDIDLLPPTFDEVKAKNFKPDVQTQWTLAQSGNGQLFDEEGALNYLNFYGNLLKVADTQMGEIISLLKGKGREDDLKNTMFVSTSDHGEMAMSHGGMTQKMFNAYDESIRVPLIWSNTEYFKGGQTTDALVSTIDFLPTALNFLGVDRQLINDSDLRGVDYSEILRKASSSGRKNLRNVDVQDSILYTYDDIYAGQDPRLSAGGNFVHGLLPANNRLQALRTKDYKYVRYFSGDQVYNAKNWDGEFYDLRPKGKDYYPNRNSSGELNPFPAAPLELRNLDPKAEASRRRQERRGIGDGPIATRKQKKAYVKMSKELDQMIEDKLRPLPQSAAVEPTFFRYNGGSYEDEGTNYAKGDPIIKFFPNSSNGTTDLELAFVTRAGQSYNILYEYQGESFTAIENIVGTNGPTYQYISGLPGGLTREDVLIDWIGDTTPLSELS